MESFKNHRPFLDYPINIIRCVFTCFGKECRDNQKEHRSTHRKNLHLTHPVKELRDEERRIQDTERAHSVAADTVIPAQNAIGVDVANVTSVCLFRNPGCSPEGFIGFWNELTIAPVQIGGQNGDVVLTGNALEIVWEIMFSAPTTAASSLYTSSLQYLRTSLSR